MFNELVILALRDVSFSLPVLQPDLINFFVHSVLLVAGWKIFKGGRSPEVDHAPIPEFGTESNFKKDKQLPDSGRQPAVSSPPPNGIADEGSGIHKNGRWRTQKKDDSSKNESSVTKALNEERKKVATLTARLRNEEEKVAALEASANSPETQAATRQSLVEKNRIVGERNQLESELKKKCAEFDELANQHAELHEVHLIVKADSKNELDELEAELAEMKEQLNRSDSSEEFALLQKALFRAQSIQAKLDAEILDLQTQLAQSDERESDVESNLASKTDSIDKLRGQIELLESELLKTKESAHTVEVRLSEKEQALTDTVSALEKTGTALEFAESRSVCLKNELETEVARLRNVVEESEEEKSELSATIETLQEKQT